LKTLRKPPKLGEHGAACKARRVGGNEEGGAMKGISIQAPRIRDRQKRALRYVLGGRPGSEMSNPIRAVVRDGRIELLDKVKIPDGMELMVTPLPLDEPDFWMKASESALEDLWNNSEDDVYAELLKK
jgi:hypothetical protein